MTQNNFPEFDAFDPPSDLRQKSRAILNRYHPVVESDESEFFGRFTELPGVLAGADTHDECLRRLLFLGETYIAFAIKGEIPLPEPANI